MIFRYCRKGAEKLRRRSQGNKKSPFISSLSTELENLKSSQPPSFLKLANSMLAIDKRYTKQTNKKAQQKYCLLEETTKDDEEKKLSSTPVFKPIP